MALIYHYPGLITYPVTLDARKSYPYYEFRKERLRAMIWKHQSMGAKPAEGPHQWKSYQYVAAGGLCC